MSFMDNTIGGDSSGTGLMSLNFIEQVGEARLGALAAYEKGAQMLIEAFAQITKAEEIAAVAHGGHRHYRSSTREEQRLDCLRGKGFDAAKTLEAVRITLDAAIWTRMLQQTGLERMMDKQERDEFDRALSGDEVPEASTDNIKATFQRLCGDAELIFQRGLARAFMSLDRRFKSHDGFKIGSRIILDRLMDSDSGSFNYSGRMEGTFTDVERIFAILEGVTPAPGMLRRQIDLDRRGWGPRQSETETRFFKIRIFKNGNAHLWFARPDLVQKVNQKLAEYYGEALPDAAPADSSPDIFRNRSNLPAKDLAFYPTPARVAEAALSEIYFQPGLRVLEPSAGIGGLVWPLAEKGATVDAVEIHPDRAAALAGRCHPSVRVSCANFLSMNPVPDYDCVVMNPPFAGTHWMDHVMHAWAFLKPGGKLVAILPATAEIGETQKHLRFHAWLEKANSSRYGRKFKDLPPEIFREVGVNINTVILTITR